MRDIIRNSFVCALNHFSCICVDSCMNPMSSLSCVSGHYGEGMGGDSSSSGGELEAGELVIDDSYKHLSKKKKKSKKSKKKKEKEKDREKDKGGREKKHSKGSGGD